MDILLEEMCLIRCDGAITDIRTKRKIFKKTRHLWQLLEYFQFYYMKNYEKQRYLVVLAIYLMFHRKTEGVSKDPEGTALSNFVTRFNKNQFSLRINCIRSFHISSIFSY